MMTIGLIALDLDGTLLDSQKNLSERNRRALERCARMGIQIVPTTGRAVDGITQAVRFLPGVNYAITTNGGTVADLIKGISLKRCTLSNAKALEVMDIVKKYRAMYDPYIDGRGISQPEFIEHMEDYGLSPVIQKMVLSTRDVVPNILHYVTDCKKDVEKVNVYLADVNDAMPLRRELSAVQGIVISSSLYNNMESMHWEPQRVLRLCGWQIILGLPPRPPWHLVMGKMISLCWRRPEWALPWEMDWT